MSLHEQCVGATDEWYTPPHVFTALGCQFSVDVASPGAAITPWIPAKRFIKGGALERDWRDFGFVWMNPPFGARNGIVPWLDKFFEHGNGIALVPDRTSAPWWQNNVRRAELVLFISPKLQFIGADGKPGKSPAQGTCLLSAGDTAYEALCRAEKNALGIVLRT
jgi:hypothetical protein